MSISWQRVERRPAVVVRPPAASLDEAYDAIEQWEYYSRKRLDPEQRLAVELMMATNADGSWAARTTGRAVSRQNGKGDEIEVVEAWGLTQRAEPIVHTAHEIPTAKSAHKRLVAHLHGHRDLRRKVAKVRYVNGDQSIEMVNGGVIVYRTRTAGGGRGLDDIARLVVDEAQHAQAEQLASSTPILAVNPNPQTNFTGSAGIAGRSAFWWSQRKRGIAGERGEFSWLEHSAERPELDRDGRVMSAQVDVEDRENWRAANFAYPGRISDDYLAEQLRILGPALYGREHLCVWDPEPDAAGSVFPSGAWRACEDPKSGPTGPVAFGLDVSPDRASAAIVVSAESGRGGRHVEITGDDDVFDHRPGTAWAVDRLVALQSRWGGRVAVAKGSPAWSMEPELVAAGVDVVEVSPEEHAQACSEIYAAVVEGRLRHLGQPELDAAVAGADRRNYGQDAWLWARRTSAADICPLVAATLAHWEAAKPPAEVGTTWAAWA